MKPIIIEVAKENKFLCLVGPHRLGIICPDKNRILMGRGSGGLLNNVRYYHQAPKKEPILVIGNYCEASIGCIVLVGGEHDNRSAWNMAYGHLPVVSQQALSIAGLPRARSKAATEIGSNVVLSYGSLLISGARIGTGAVIGAGAVVAGEVPAKSIWVGNPGQAKPRFEDTEQSKVYDAIEWERLPVGGLLEMEKLVTQNSASEIRQYFEKLPKEPFCRLWFDAKTSERKIDLKNMIGAEIDGRMFRPSQFPPPFIKYFQQANSEETSLSWVPDAFAAYWK